MKPNKTIIVKDFMGEEEEHSVTNLTRKPPGKNLDLAKIVDEFILK